jgi:hypothetical protein
VGFFIAKNSNIMKTKQTRGLTVARPAFPDIKNYLNAKRVKSPIPGGTVLTLAGKGGQP